MDERYDMMRAVMDSRWLYIHNYRPDLPYVQPLSYMFQARGYQSWARVAAEGKLTPATSQFWGEKPTEELYDMEADPDSVQNLAASPEHRDTLEQNARGAEGACARRPRTTDSCPKAPRWKATMLPTRPAHGRSSECIRSPVWLPNATPRIFRHLIEALADDSEPVRWWAAQGCAMLGQKAAPAEAALKARLDDTSGAVAVAAAEALARLGKAELALPVLERWIQRTDSPGFIQQAANVLDRLGETARPLLPAMKRALTAAPPAKGGTYPPQQILHHAIEVLEGRTQGLVYPHPNAVGHP